MNKNILIVLGGAVLVAFLVALLVQLSIGGKKPPAPVEEVKTVNILVAAKDLKSGDELSGDAMTWKAWPQNAMFPGIIIQKENQPPADAVSGRLKEDVLVGNPILTTSLLGDREGNIVANVLPEGMRAVSIAVSAEGMVAGFIKPGDYVDVVMSYRATFSTDDSNPQIQEMVARNLDRMAVETILQNVKVLAVDQTAGKGGKEDAKVGRTVTLAVDRQEAEQLVLAAQLGKLTLVLRGLGDRDVTPPDWPTTTDKRMTKIEDEIFTEYKKMKKDTGINPDIVRIYSGGDVSTAPVQ
ncbi:MAG: Flp pilus assembly protein CpaB [Alphaproteobacteria bacterium]|nr:Flp pilus assembly protein CpaB [Alphaproteobacteria bacterium]MCD8520010.1 Flp pilus assembly protein CpaB [Alphaproteobacteria bacterium]MCD8571738.1 Flp pilus assembly protein CpaB [Alphaproteobacteria bacterium]